ncbi:MAG: 3'-5' exonuclease, partial [Ignavibacteriales bacterium]
MRKIVFDIETCAFPFESLSESQQEYLLRYAEKEI